MSVYAAVLDITQFDKTLGGLTRIGLLLNRQEKPEQAWHAVLMELLSLLDAPAAAVFLRMSPRHELGLRATAYAQGGTSFPWSTCLAGLAKDWQATDGWGSPIPLSGLQFGSNLGDHWLLHAPLAARTETAGLVCGVVTDPDPESLPRRQQLLNVVATQLACDKGAWQRAAATGSPEMSATIETATTEDGHAGCCPAASTCRNEDLKTRVAQLEKEMLAEALAATDGNVAAAARQLGLTARIARYKIKKLGVEYRRPSESPARP